MNVKWVGRLSGIRTQSGQTKINDEINTFIMKFCPRCANLKLKYVTFMVTRAIRWMKYSIHILRNFNGWGWVGVRAVIRSREFERKKRRVQEPLQSLNNR
jgi:hypothetical protein